MTATPIFINFILHDPPGYEIRYEYNEGYDPGDRGNYGGQEGTADPRAEGEQKCDEGDGAGDRMEDLDTG